MAEKAWHKHTEAKFKTPDDLLYWEIDAQSVADFIQVCPYLLSSAL